MGFLDLQQLQLFFIFLVPGMVALYVRAQLLDGRLPSFSSGILIYAAISLIYHALWFTFNPHIYNYSLSNSNIFQKLYWLFVIIILPSIIGLIDAIIIRNQWAYKLFQKFGIQIINPVKSAWDWKFSQTPESWVIVKLKDGTEWGGVLGPQSFISSSPEERDIFIQTVYKIEQVGWIERNSSVLITHDQIQSIEFWPKGA